MRGRSLCTAVGVSKSSSKEREVCDAQDTCSKDAIPERCSDAKIAFVVSIVVHRVMEARTIEIGARRRRPDMYRVMDQQINSVSPEHAHRQADCKGWGEGRHWHKRDEEDDNRSEQW